MGSNGIIDFNEILNVVSAFKKKNAGLSERGMQITKIFEGFEELPYMDSKGKLTSGYGFNLEDPYVRSLMPQDYLDAVAGDVTKDPTMTEEKAEPIFKQLYKRAYDDAITYLGSQEAFDRLDDDTKDNLVDMSYNLGLTKLRGDKSQGIKGFTEMKEELLKNNKKGIAREMKDSDWYGQTGRRGRHHVETTEGKRDFLNLSMLNIFGAKDAEASDEGSIINFKEIEGVAKKFKQEEDLVWREAEGRQKFQPPLTQEERDKSFAEYVLRKEGKWDVGKQINKVITSPQAKAITKAGLWTALTGGLYPVVSGFKGAMESGTDMKIMDRVTKGIMYPEHTPDLYEKIQGAEKLPFWGKLLAGITENVLLYGVTGYAKGKAKVKLFAKQSAHDIERASEVAAEELILAKGGKVYVDLPAGEGVAAGDVSVAMLAKDEIKDAFINEYYHKLSAIDPYTLKTGMQEAFKKTNLLKLIGNELNRRGFSVGLSIKPVVGQPVAVMSGGKQLAGKIVEVLGKSVKVDVGGGKILVSAADKLLPLVEEAGKQPTTAKGGEASLIQEAKKYKSAEEWMKSKPYSNLSSARKRQLLKQWKQETGYNEVSSEFKRGAEDESIHAPADPESGSPLYDLTEKGTYPEDVYSMKGLDYYGTGEPDMDRKAYSIISALEANPRGEVKIYRALEKDGKPIQPGDWVTIVRQYAKEHGESALKGDYKIVSKTVSARDIFTSGDSWLEWGYHPQKERINVRKQLTDIYNKAQGITEVLVKEKLMRGETLSKEESDFVSKQREKYNELVEKSPEEAAKMSKEDFDKWSGTRGKESYLGLEDLKRADEAHKAMVLRGEMFTAENIRNRVNFLDEYDKETGEYLPENAKKNKIIGEKMIEMEQREKDAQGKGEVDFKIPDNVITKVREDGFTAGTAEEKKQIAENLFNFLEEGDIVERTGTVQEKDESGNYVDKTITYTGEVVIESGRKIIKGTIAGGFNNSRKGLELDTGQPFKLFEGDKVIKANQERSPELDILSSEFDADKYIEFLGRDVAQGKGEVTAEQAVKQGMSADEWVGSKGKNFEIDVIGNKNKFKVDETGKEGIGIKAVEKNRKIIQGKLIDVVNAEKADDKIKSESLMREAVVLAERSNLVLKAFEKEFGAYRQGYDIQQMKSKIIGGKRSDQLKYAEQLPALGGEEKVKVYRGIKQEDIEKGIESEKKIYAGDFVSLDKNYANTFGDVIVEDSVPASDLRVLSGNKELIYSPKSALSEYEKAKGAQPPIEPPKKPPTAEGAEDWDDDFKELGRSANIESIEDIKGMQDALAEADLFLKEAKNNILKQVKGKVKALGSAEERLLPKSVFSAEGGYSLDRIASREDVSNSLNVLGYSPDEQGLREFISDFIGEQKVGGGIIKKEVKKPGAEFASVLKRNKQNLKDVIMLGRKLAKPLSPGQVKSTVLEKTGVTQKGEKVLTEQQALKLRLQQQAKGAKIGAKDARQTAIRDMMVKMKSQKTSVEQVKKDFVEYAQANLDTRERGKLLSQLKNVKTKKQLARSMQYIDKLHEQEIRKEAIGNLKKTIQKIDIKKLRPEYKSEVSRLVSLDMTGMTEKKFISLSKTATYLADHPDNNIPENKLRELERLSTKNIKSLTTDEINLITSSVQHLMKLHDLKNNLIFGNKYKAVQEVVNQAIENIKKKKAQEVDPNTISTKGKEEKKVGVTKELFTTQSWNAEFITEILDKEVNGVIHEVIYKGVNGGTTETLRKEQFAKDFFDEKHKGINFDGWSKAFHTKEADVDFQKIKLPSGKTIELTKGERLAVYLHRQNTNNLRHLLNGGFSFEASKNIKHELDGDDVNAIVESMTDEEMTVVRSMQEYYGTHQKNMLNETSVKLNGYEIAVEDNYFHIRTNYLDRIRDILKMSKNFTHKALENMGILKERTNASNAIILEDAFSATFKSIRQSCAYAGFAEPLRNAKMVLNNPEFRKNVSLSYGEHYLKNLDSYLKDVEDNAHDVELVDKLTLDLINKLDIAVLGINPFVILKQTVSLPAAATILDMKYIAKAITPESIEVMSKWSPQQRLRFTGRVTREHGEIGQVGQTRRFWTGKTTLSQKLMGGISEGDYQAIGRIWKACQFEIEDKFPALTGDEKMQKIADRADEVIRKTQPTFDVKDRSPIGRSRSVFVRLATKYSSQRNKNYMMAFRTVEEYNRSAKTPKDKAKFMKSMFILAVVMPLMIKAIDSIRGIAYGRKPSKKEDGWFGKTLGYFENLLGNAYFVGDAFSTIKSKYFRGSYAGWDMENIFYSTVNRGTDGIAESLRAIEQVINQDKYKSGKWKKTAQMALDYNLETALKFKGIPYYTIKKIIQSPKNIYDFVTSKAGAEDKSSDLIEVLEKRLKRYKKQGRPKAVIDRLKKRIERLKKRR